jgi:hypothetical protein
LILLFSRFSFFLFHSAFHVVFFYLQRGRPPFPMERRPNSLVYALQSTLSVKLYP